MSDHESDFESDSFDEDDADPEAGLGRHLTAVYQNSDKLPLHVDGQPVGGSVEGFNWLLTPKKLFKLAAQVVINLKPPRKLQERYIPSHLYPLLFAEAARMKNDEAVWFLVSTWPFEVLNMNELELPIECHLGYFTRNREETATTVPLAHSVIRGLLYRSRMKCRMKMIILPKVVSNASELLKTFACLPVYFLRDLPDVSIPKLLRNAEYHEGEKFMELIKKFETKRPISYIAYRKDKLRLIITIPAGIVHFTGTRQNYDEVIAGLILQRHSPFLFHFEDLAICNIPTTQLAGAILDRIVNPLGVTKLVLHNKRFYRPDNVESMVSALCPVLRKFERLRTVVFRVIGVLGVRSLPASDTRAPFDDAFSCWTELRRVGFDQQPLSGQLGRLLEPLAAVRLLKLSLVDATLQPDDLRALARSPHASSLRFLRVDGNDLHAGLSAFLELVSCLRSVVVLQTRRCRLTFDDAMAIAGALGDSTCAQTLRSWTLAYSYVHSLSELKALLRRCSRVGSLREVGCRPAEYQRLLGRLFMHNRFVLTDDEKEELATFGRSLNIDII